MKNKLLASALLLIGLMTFSGCNTGQDIKDTVIKTNLYSEECLNLYSPSDRHANDTQLIVVFTILEGCETRKLIRELHKEGN